MNDSQFVILTAVETDADDRQVTPADQLTWTVDSDAVTLTVSDDTLSVTVTAVTVGAAMVTVSDPGANLISDPFEVDVTASPATAIVIEAGTPQDQAAPSA
jgi:hypothetical protein